MPGNNMLSLAYAKQLLANQQQNVGEGQDACLQQQCRQQQQYLITEQQMEVPGSMQCSELHSTSHAFIAPQPSFTSYTLAEYTDTSEQCTSMPHRFDTQCLKPTCMHVDDTVSSEQHTVQDIQTIPSQEAPPVLAHKGMVLASTQSTPCLQQPLQPMHPLQQHHGSISASHAKQLSYQTAFQQATSLPGTAAAAIPMRTVNTGLHSCTDYCSEPPASWSADFTPYHQGSAPLQPVSSGRCMLLPAEHQANQLQPDLMLQSTPENITCPQALTSAACPDPSTGAYSQGRKLQLEKEQAAVKEPHHDVAGLSARPGLSAWKRTKRETKVSWDSTDLHQYNLLQALMPQWQVCKVLTAV